MRASAFSLYKRANDVTVYNKSVLLEPHWQLCFCGRKLWHLTFATILKESVLKTTCQGVQRVPGLQWVSKSCIEILTNKQTSIQTKPVVRLKVHSSCKKETNFRNKWHHQNLSLPHSSPVPVTWSTVVSLCLSPVTDGSLSNAAYLITVMNFIITSTPSEKNEGH